MSGYLLMWIRNGSGQKRIRDGESGLETEADGDCVTSPADVLVFCSSEKGELNYPQPSFLFLFVSAAG